jgi:hypothetical protein
LTEPFVTVVSPAGADRAAQVVALVEITSSKRRQTIAGFS